MHSFNQIRFRLLNSIRNRLAKRAMQLSYWEQQILEKHMLRLLMSCKPQQFPILPVEVHMLLSKENLLMGLWAARSFQHFTQKNWYFVFQNDGSMDSQDVELLQRHFLNGEVVSRIAADKKMEEQLKDFPECLAARRAHIMFLKLFDPFMHSKRDRYVLLDSDILFFKSPEEIIRWAVDSDPGFRFNADCINGYCVPTESLETRFKVKMWQRVNAGLALIPRKSILLHIVEEYLREFKSQSTHNLWLEQTAYALLASLDGKGALLPPSYELSFEPNRKLGCIARHYVTSDQSRPYFYREGIVTLAGVLL